MYNEMTNEEKAKFAAQMVIMDAIGRGHTNKTELIAYMKSETFIRAVNGYLNQMKQVG